jgi:hypothetical protein
MKTAKNGTKRGRTARHQTASRSQPSGRVKRVAFNVTETLDKNIEVFALREGRLKNEVFIEALRNLLEAHRMDPDREPILSLSYR